MSFLQRTALATLVTTGVLGSGLAAASGLNMTEGVTPFSREVYGLHMTILGICAAIGVLVYGAMFYSIVKHRKSKGVTPAKFHHSTKVEIIWTLVPFLILVVMAVPATKALINMEDVGEYDMTVKVTGYQWMWSYDYIDSGVSFYSRLDSDSDRVRQKGSGENPAEVENYLLEVDNRLVLPTDTKIRFLLTSDDVIHSWWVPDLGWKRDAMPGFINEAWTVIEEPGIYRGQCAELCGKDHGFMPVVVEAVPPEEFEAWVAEQGGDESGSNAASVAAAQ